MKRDLRIFLAGAMLALPACSSLTNGNAQLPSVNQVPLGTLGKLTFAVGTARLQDGSTGLNVVAYARKSDGSTPFLVDTPTITGPSGFTVPSSTMNANGGGGSGSDAGTATIGATPQSTAAPPANGTTFGMEGGLYAGGFGPFNATATASNFYPGQAAPGGPNPTFTTPFYEANSGNNTSTDPRAFLVGPPANGITAFTNVSYPNNFAGYLPGFTAFEVTPVTGSYSLKVDVSAANAASTSLTATATLASTTALPAVPMPSFTKDGGGGGTVSVNIPAGATETLVFVHDLGYNGGGQSVYYTLGPISGTGTQTAALGDTLGPCSGTAGCNAATMMPGDKFEITAISFDYPDFEAIQPISKAQVPTVTGASGQADLSISPAFISTY
jgi:hypothetical protein